MQSVRLGEETRNEANTSDRYERIPDILDTGRKSRRHLGLEWLSESVDDGNDGV